MFPVERRQPKKARNRPVCVGYDCRMVAGEWHPDVLGNGFEQCELALGTDEEGAVVATLIRYRPTAQVTPRRRFTLGRILELLRQARADRTSMPEPAPHAMVYVHGWNDYFFHVELAEFWAELGVAAYAVDLRKYGRSIRPHQTPGFITDLADYDADLDAAIAAVRHDQRSLRGLEPDAPVKVSLMAHSAGGLISALWADRNPGALHSLILNSPWLELSGSSLLRNATAPLIEPLARVRPRARLKLPEFGLYWRSLSNQADGEWELNSQWRREFGFPIRAGWLSAIMAGHARVARGLNIDVPVLVLFSARSLISPVWSEQMKEADIVLDVDQIAARAANLGRQVSLNRVEGALHDVLLSRPEVRRSAYADLRQWARAYLADG